MKIIRLLASTVCLAFSALASFASDDGKVITGYVFEDFENGTPAGWDVGMFYMADGGVDGSRGMWDETFYGDDALTTHYVRMGEQPSVSFEYKVYDLQFGSQNVAAADPKNVKFRIEISDDEGQTWKPVYRIQPEGGDMKHQMSNDFAKVSVSLPQYAGKTCRVRIAIDYFLSPDMKYCRYVVDNVSIGTPNATDMSVYGLSGPAFLRKGVQTEYSVTVANKGVASSSNYTANLVDSDGNVLSECISKEIAAGSEYKAVFSWIPAKEGLLAVKAVVKADADANTSNDETPVSYVNVSAEDPDVISVGEALKSSTLAPMNLYARNSYIQTVYNANDLGLNKMTISGLRYRTHFKLPLQVCLITVWVGETNKDHFATEGWVDVTSLSKVFEGQVYVDVAKQTMEIAFQTPYEYNGRNLVVCLLRNDKDFFSDLNFLQDDDPRYSGATISSVNDYTEPFTSADGTVTYPVSPEHPGESSVFNLVPVTDFIVAKNPSGKVKGTVKSSSGEVLPKACISVEGTQVSVQVEDDGSYELSLAGGNYTLSVACPGYFGKNVQVEVAVNKETHLDIVLTRLNSFMVEGRVCDLDGSSVKDVKVQALGYRNYKTETAEDGTYRFDELLSEDGTDYVFRISAAGYESEEKKVDLTKNPHLDFTIKEQLERPYAVVAVNNGATAFVRWENPLKEYRYDAPGAQVIDYAGYKGWMNSVIGTAFPFDSSLKEVSWFTTDLGGTTHSTVSLVITELDEIGWPTRKVLKVVQDVPNTDNRWSRYVFDTPLECPNGFFVGVNYPYDNTNVDLCFTEADEEYPVVAGRYFACDDINYESDSRSRFADLSSTYKGNMLIRAVGVDKGSVDYTDYGKNRVPGVAARTSVGCTYRVYRFAEGQEEDKWTLLQEGITANEFEDKDFGSLTAGKYGYAVAAEYPSGVSSFRISDLIDNTQGGIGGITTEDVNVIGIYRLDGTLVVQHSDAARKLAAGIYIVRYSDGITKKITLK